MRSINALYFLLLSLTMNLCCNRTETKQFYVQFQEGKFSLTKFSFPFSYLKKNVLKKKSKKKIQRKKIIRKIKEKRVKMESENRERY